MRFIPSSIYVRLLVTVIVIGVLPIAATSATVIWMNQHSLTAQSTRELTGLARGFIGQIETYLSDARAQSTLIASLPDLVDGSDAQRTQLLRTAYIQYTTFSQLTLYDLEGRVRATSDAHAVPLAQLSPGFVSVRAGGPQAWELSERDGRLTVTIFTVVYNNQSMPLGVLGSVIDTSRIAGEISREPIQGEGAVFVLDTTGKMLAHSDQAQIGSISSIPVARSIIAQRPAGPGTIRYTDRGVMWFAGYAPSNQLGWVVFVERPERVVLAPVVQATQITLTLLVLSILFAFAGSMLVIRLLVAPLRQLAAAARDFGRGKTNTRLPELYGSDDMSALVGAFAEMRSVVSQALDGERAERLLNQTILESVPSSLLVLDPNLRVRSVNPAALALFRSHEQSLSNRPIEDILQTGQLNQRMNDVVTSGEAQRNILFRHTFFGDEHLLRLAFSPVKRRDTTAVQWLLVTIEDLTELVEIQQRNEELQALQAIGQVVLSVQSLPELLQSILLQTLAVVQANLGCIYLFEDEGTAPITICSHAADPLYQQLSERYQAQLATVLMDSQRPHVIAVPPAKIDKLPQGGTLVGIPILASQRLIGAIMISTTSSRWFQPHEIRLLEAIGGQVGLAVQKSSLYDQIYSAYSELRQTQTTLTLQYEVAQTLTREQPFETALTSTVEQICAALGAVAGQVLVVNHQGQLQSVARHTEHSLSVALSTPAALGWAVHSDGLGGLVCPLPQPALPAEAAQRRTIVAIAIKGVPLGVLELAGAELISSAHQTRMMIGLAEQIGQFLERDKAQEALRESEERFRQIAEQVSDVFWMADPIDGRLLYVSPAFEAIWGCGRDTLQRSPLRFIGSIPRADRGDVRASLKQFGAQPQALEHRVVRPDGTIRWVLSRTVPVYDGNGRAYRIIGSCEDITARKQAEEALRRANAELVRTNAELARAVRMKDEFLATMSHELRTPLNAILGRAEVLREEIHGPLSKGQQRSLRSIDESGRHLLSLINDILDLSKIEAGKLDLSAEPVAVGALLNAATRMVSQAALKKQISLHVEIDAGSGVLIGDERRLKQVLVNLLSNAVKFTPTGGSVGVEVHHNALHGQLDITIWDTGIGIAPADLNRLFRPFVQLDSRLARDHGGTGLGLTLVARMVALHGGSVQVASTLGEGSSFTVSLPWESSDPLTAGEPVRRLPLPGTSSAHFHVLIAMGDEPAGLSAALTAQGCSATVVRSGLEVLAGISETRPDVVLLDQHMPQIDGLTLLRELRNQPDLKQTPVAIISTLVFPGDAERCSAAGADAYLVNPLRQTELCATLHQLALAHAKDVV